VFRDSDVMVEVPMTSESCAELPFSRLTGTREIGALVGVVV